MPSIIYRANAENNVNKGTLALQKHPSESAFEIPTKILTMNNTEK